MNTREKQLENALSDMLRLILIQKPGVMSSGWDKCPDARLLPSVQKAKRLLPSEYPDANLVDRTGKPGELLIDRVPAVVVEVESCSHVTMHGTKLFQGVGPVVNSV